MPEHNESETVIASFPVLVAEGGVAIGRAEAESAFHQAYTAIVDMAQAKFEEAEAAGRKDFAPFDPVVISLDLRVNWDQTDVASARVRMMAFEDEEAERVADA